MTEPMDLSRFKAKAALKDRYLKQLERLRNSDIATACIEEAVDGAIASLATLETKSIVIYGDPQSGKTEMMICLTAMLLDKGYKIIVHLMNDSVDLLTQNLKRFKTSGLAPAPRNSSELINDSDAQSPVELVVFCKKNARDLEKLTERLKGSENIVVIDDEADYATPNSRINQGAKTRINELVEKLIGNDGRYVGVTATPARLDLNNTFNNTTEKWVNFPAHPNYTGQEHFFPLNKTIDYRLNLLKKIAGPEDAQDALVRFLVSSAYQNLYVNSKEENYTMLVHTSGKKEDHKSDRKAIEHTVNALLNSESEEFSKVVSKVYTAATSLFPDRDANHIVEYVVSNASRATLVVLNSERDRIAAGDNPTGPSSPFTIIIGGNIVSRGVTFPNLLSMYFTRDVKNKLQQDTYIQRARMFGARGSYLKQFELTIPEMLYADWHKCFVFHRLALATIKGHLGSPVWLGDGRISVASNASINKATVALDRGEMSFGLFDYEDELDNIVREDQTAIQTLKNLREKIGNDALPEFLIDYISTLMVGSPSSLAIHIASDISGSVDANQDAVSRAKGFMGKSQLEPRKFPNALHHIKIFFNADKNAKLFYKYKGSLQFIQNMKQ